LDPICDFFQNLYNKKFNRHPEGRLHGTIITYFLIILFLTIIIFFAGRYIGGSLSADNLLSEGISQLNTMYLNIMNFLKRHNLYEVLSKYIDTIWSDILGFFDNLGNSLIKGAAGFGGFLLNIILGFVIAFYLLKDKKKYLSLSKRFFSRILPEKIYKA
ncbi:MAG: hypothetical protein LIO44_01415, partial [Eubacterium sp.]|nr:hypothetical protein [Eubacterium sp.]